MGIPIFPLTAAIAAAAMLFAAFLTVVILVSQAYLKIALSEDRDPWWGLPGWMLMFIGVFIPFLAFAGMLSFTLGSFVYTWLIG
jgi:hypothetical protein